MNETVAVRVIERLGNLGPELDDLLGAERAPRHPFGKGFALQILQDQEGAIPVLSEIVDPANVRVFEPRS